ncbi:hypothetical protein BGX27_002198 [Mortierella sp. AM989]|nr:hypothetical protein BGX27_002198 [Mortierella sp. AM989]
MPKKPFAVAIFVLAASVSAQADFDYTHFTSPISNDGTYTAGQSATFSWEGACIAPAKYTSETPTTTPIQLYDASVPSNAFYVMELTTIDCTKSSGSGQWTVPTGLSTKTSYTLAIGLNGIFTFSGSFTVQAPTKSTSTSTASSTTTSASSESVSSSNMIAILGGSLGCLFLVAVLGAVYFYRRHNKLKNVVANQEGKLGREDWNPESKPPMKPEMESEMKLEMEQKMESEMKPEKKTEVINAVSGKLQGTWPSSTATTTATGRSPHEVSNLEERGNQQLHGHLYRNPQEYQDNQPIDMAWRNPQQILETKPAHPQQLPYQPYENHPQQHSYHQ